MKIADLIAGLVILLVGAPTLWVMEAQGAGPVFTPAPASAPLFPKPAVIKTAPPVLRPLPVNPTIADVLKRIEELEGRAIVAGGGISGPLGRTCAEARERMRWSDLPCSPFHPER
jgi:hypothetical protein